MQFPVMEVSTAFELGLMESIAGYSLSVVLLSTVEKTGFSQVVGSIQSINTEPFRDCQPRKALFQVRLNSFC